MKRELRGTAMSSNLRGIQSFQSKLLCRIAIVTFYFCNKALHKDFNIPFVQELTNPGSNPLIPNCHPNPRYQSLSSPTHPQNPLILTNPWSYDNFSTRTTIV